MPEHISAENLRHRLRWLDNLRWFVATGLVGLTLFVHFTLRLAIAWRALLALAAVIAFYNVLCLLLRLHLETKPRDALAFDQLERLTNAKIALDLLLLTLVFHSSGGVENPFIVLYLLYPILAAMLLTPRSAYMQAGWATILFIGMAVCEAVWPALHHPVGGYLPTALFREPLVIAGEAAALVVSLYFCVYRRAALPGGFTGGTGNCAWRTRPWRSDRRNLRWRSTSFRNWKSGNPGSSLSPSTNCAARWPPRRGAWPRRSTGTQTTWPSGSNLCVARASGFRECCSSSATC